MRDPLTGLPFANNQIPASRIDPYAAAIIGLVPLPNQPGPTNFFRTADLIDNADRLLTRLDWKPSASDSIFGRYIYSNRTRQIPGAFGGVVDGTGTSAFGNQTIKTNALVGGWTKVISSAMVNEFRFSWSQATSDAVQQSFGLTAPSGATIPGSVTNPIVAGGLPGITIDTYFGGSGLGRIGSPDFLPKFQHTNQFEFIDTVSWLRGNHAVKAGVDLMGPMNNEFMDVPATRGALRFRNTFTGNAMADYLLGYVVGPAALERLRHQPAPQRADVLRPGRLEGELASVAEPRPALRLHDAGARSQQRDDQLQPGRDRVVDLRHRRLAAAAQPGQPGSQQLRAAGRRRLQAGRQHDSARRLRDVLQPVRSRRQRGSAVAEPAGAGQQDDSDRDRGHGPIFFLQQGFPAGFLNAPNLDPAAGQLKAVRLRSVDQNDPNTTTQQASFGMQRELPGSMVLSADFVYTRTSNLATLVNLNQPLPNAAGNNALGALPYPNFGFIEWRSDNGRAEYKGLDLGLEKRFARGYAFGFAYTIGKSEDNASEQLTTQGSNAFPQNSRDFEPWFGPSDYDVRHRFSANFVWALPLGNNAIARDWTVSGIYTAHTGHPFTVTQSNNNVGTNMTGLPNVSGDTDGPKTVDKWFNKAAFTTVTSGTFGNEERNRLYGPGFQNVDLTVQRALKFGPRLAATLRLDLFNVFNTVNFGIPNKDIATASTFGTITGLASDPRTMQLAIRFAF